MDSSKPLPLPLSPLRNDPKSISSAARTICLAFSQDPLVRWLRPCGIPWNHLDDPEIAKWQYRRVQRAMVEGMVLACASVGDMDALIPRRQTLLSSPNKKDHDADYPSNSTTTRIKTRIIQEGDEDKDEDEDEDDNGSDAAAVLFLFPPPSHPSMEWSLCRFWMACKLWLLDALCPAKDSGTNEARLDRLMDAHEAGKSLLPSENLWYLEIIAVHPDLQGQGLGGKIMRQTLEQIGNEPVFLECTREDNLGFYERLGFRIVKRVVLEDEGDDLVYWVMLRQSVWNKEQ